MKIITSNKLMTHPKGKKASNKIYKNKLSWITLDNNTNNKMKTMNKKIYLMKNKWNKWIIIKFKIQ